MQLLQNGVNHYMIIRPRCILQETREKKGRKYRTFLNCTFTWTLWEKKHDLIALLMVLQVIIRKSSKVMLKIIITCSFELCYIADKDLSEYEPQGLGMLWVPSALTLPWIASTLPIIFFIFHRESQANVTTRSWNSIFLLRKSKIYPWQCPTLAIQTKK